VKSYLIPFIGLALLFVSFLVAAGYMALISAVLPLRVSGRTEWLAISFGGLVVCCVSYAGLVFWISR
jgi:hypothetical protein